MLEVGTVEVRSLRQRGIERRQKLVNELQRLGFGVIDDPRICKRGEIILNRGLDSPNSNFCVAMKTSFLGRTKVIFTDPSKGEGGKALSKRELMRRHSSFGVSDAWVDRVRDDIIRVSRAKDTNTRFVLMHGHWGENEGKDDGASSARKIIREMLLWNYDVDATGFHNNVLGRFIRNITELESACGILKVPSIELTLPRRNPDDSNGPHLNIYFRDIDAAESFYRLIEDRLVRVFPGMAPVLERAAVLGRISDMRERDELALGVAHPYGETELGFGTLSMGLLNELGADESLPWVFDFVRRYADLVAIYNPTFSNAEVSLVNRMIPDAFFREIIDRYVGSNAKMTQNNITYSFAMYCKHTFGKRVYFDHDSHTYAGVPWYWRMVSPLAYGRTVLHFTDREKAREMFAKKDFTASDFVQLLRHGNFRRNGDTINAKVSYDAFVELRGGKLLPVKARRSPLYWLASVREKIRQGIQYLTMLNEEKKRRNENMLR
ncbi:MAG: hypothetical protein WC350_00835 [Candidatus Micrarchaeia archaeon]|jgi:hypothetical protein